MCLSSIKEVSDRRQIVNFIDHPSISLQHLLETSITTTSRLGPDAAEEYQGRNRGSYAGSQKGVAGLDGWRIMMENALAAVRACWRFYCLPK